ncbi:MAG: GAF domain-containing protein [Pseudomonadota bacterium]|nr:GAF domain-containing protein [Pseudomonadota bacterium]
MQARLIAYPPDNAAVVRVIPSNDSLRIGRVGDPPAPATTLSDPPLAATSLTLDHPSVSRAHAELRGEDGGWRLLDLGSKNGSFVDGIAVRDVRLEGACWLRFGDVYCEFAPLTDAEASIGVHRQHTRRTAATAHTVRLQRLTRLDDLLDASLRAVLDLAQCERGFVLLDDGNGLAVHATLSLDPAALTGRAFSGSIAAVRRTLAQRRAVVINDISSEAWLSSRASVVAAGLSALVCLPMTEGEQVLGAIYADRITRGPAISTLDLELLEAFAENASVWIAAHRTHALLDAHAAAPDWNRIVAAHTGEN